MRAGSRPGRHLLVRPLVAAARLAGALPWFGLAALTTYLAGTTVAAWWAIVRGRHRTPLPAIPTRRFVVLVPAHNEERLIGSTLESLEALDYPPELVRVHVVADNCSDDTSDIVRRHGVEVHDRIAPDDPGKGPALGWLLGRLWSRDEPHDAVLIIDADTSVSPNLLRVADALLSQGARVIQAHYAVREPEASATTALRSAALSVRHYLRPLGRSQLGGTVGLFGNGMIFAHDVLRTRSFSNHLVEDIELGLDLLLEGTSVAFAPDAGVEAEMPTTVEASRTQHERWERGRLEMTRRYVPTLLGRAVRGGPAGRFAYADAAADQLLPPFSLVVAGTAGALVTAAAGAVAFPSRRARRRIAVATIAAVVQFGYVLSGLRMVDAPTQTYRSLLSAPRLVLWKLGLLLRVVRQPEDVAWVRTERNPGNDA